jgi:dTDP-glucose 4,6-dehydratase
MRILITGGLGFIGHNMVKYFLDNTDWSIVVVDKVGYASKPVSYFDGEQRVETVIHDLSLPFSSDLKQKIEGVDFVVNLASESHVDNSINHPVPFVHNNVGLMVNMLEWARTQKNLKKFLQFSTDEVYSNAPIGVDYVEGDRFNATNPYSASKACQECLCQAYSNTYKVPIVVTNTMNVLGLGQDDEKFVPMVIKRVINGDKVFIHSNSEKSKAGSRFYIDVMDVSEAILFVLTETNELLDHVDASKGKFHIVGEREIDNLELARMISKAIGKPLVYEMVDFHSSRPGHDLRYSLCGDKMKALGWVPKTKIISTIENIVSNI